MDEELKEVPYLYYPNYWLYYPDDIGSWAPWDEPCTDGDDYGPKDNENLTSCINYNNAKGSEDRRLFGLLPLIPSLICTLKTLFHSVFPNQPNLNYSVNELIYKFLEYNVMPNACTLKSYNIGLGSKIFMFYG
jgi:hypothetical protein